MAKCHHPELVEGLWRKEVMEMHERGNGYKQSQKGDQTLPDMGITSVPELQADARRNGGRILTPEQLKAVLSSDLHPMLEGVAYITVDVTGSLGYHTAREE